MAEDDAPETEHEHEEHPGNEVPAAQEDRIVDKVVNKVRDLFDEIVGPGSGAGGGDEPPTSTAPPGPAATEADMERKVKEGVAKEITARERKTERERQSAEHEAEHERIRALTEEPPKTFSKLTTAIWGDGDS